MVSLLTLLKSRLFWGALILISLCSIIGVLRLENAKLDKKVTDLNNQLTVKTQIAQECSDATKELADSENQLKKQLADAAAKAKIAAKVHTDRANAIMLRKPTSNNDYDSANALINSVLK